MDYWFKTRNSKFFSLVLVISSWPLQIWLRRYVGIAKVSGLAIQIPECLIELDRFLDNSDVLELLPKIVGPLGDNYAKLTGLDNAWWEDDDPLLPAVTVKLT